MDNRNKVDSQPAFEELKQAIFNGDPMALAPSVYVWNIATKSSSPTQPPGESSKKVATNEDSSSGTSRDSVVQREFSAAVLTRDGSKCVVCRSTEHLTGAHVFDVKRKSTGEVLRSCGINGLYVDSNGITLCKTCHLLYDNHHLCILPGTETIVVSDAYLSWGRRKEQYAKLVGQSVTRSLPNWPPPELMRNRYEFFLENRESRRKYNEDHPHFCSECWKRWKTPKGKLNHRCNGIAGKEEHLKNLQTPMKDAIAKLIELNVDDDVGVPDIDANVDLFDDDFDDAF